MHHFPDTNVVAHLPRPTQQAKKQSIVSGRLLSHCKQLWAQIDAVPLREVVLVPVLARRVVCAFTFLVEAFWAILSSCQQGKCERIVFHPGPSSEPQSAVVVEPSGLCL